MTPTPTTSEQIPQQNGVVGLSPLDKLKRLRQPVISSQLEEGLEQTISQLDTNIEEVETGVSNINTSFIPPAPIEQPSNTPLSSVFSGLETIPVTDQPVTQKHIIEEPSVNPFFDLDKPQPSLQEVQILPETTQEVKQELPNRPELTPNPTQVSILPIPKDAQNNITPIARKTKEIKPKEPTLQTTKGNIVVGAHLLEKSLIKQLGAHDEKR